MKYQLRTDNGYDLLECASALQKCIRRGLEEEAVFWAFEIQTKYEDFLWRRLIVIANEDIGLADPHVIVLVDVLRGHYDLLKKRESGEWRLPIVNAVLALCRAQKTRLADDMATALRRRRDFEAWRLEIPDFALDKHTLRGKQAGRGWDHWREEGCRLSNEVPGMNSYEEEATRLRKQYGKPKRKKSKSQKNDGELFE